MGRVPLTDWSYPSAAGAGGIQAPRDRHFSRFAIVMFCRLQDVWCRALRFMQSPGACLERGFSPIMEP